MALSQRMIGPILTNVSSTTLFAGVDEFERMRSLRGKITEVRRAWQSDDYFNELRSKITAYTDNANLSPKTLSKIKTLLAGYTDWADMDYGRPEEPQRGWTAIELYCSEEGYNLLFGIFNAALRNQKTEEEVLLVASALVELVTIELYNLRLSNIGDPHYANYQGTTFRGMCVSAAMAAEYKKAASNPDLSKRHFGVPLGFTSSSTSKETTKEFIKQHPGEDQMHWIIHVHGLDPRLLKVYEERYPDSVVTSITAMPVGRIAELREKEILLRGAFFHIVRMESEEADGRMIHTLQLVLMNTNRDHGTELALDEGSKQKQRDFFRDMIMASRFQICSELSKDYSNADSEKYKELARTALKRIDATDPWEIAESPVPPDNTSNHLATWSGDTNGDSYPTNYLALRRKYQKAAREGDWNSVRETIDGEYEWETAEWFNIPALEHPWSGRTLLHEMASHGPPQQGSTHEQSWHYLIGKVIECEVWRTVRTADTMQTAEEIAQENSFNELAESFQPSFDQIVDMDLLSSFQTRLDAFIRDILHHHELLGDFRTPQISVLLEMKNHTLWAPIPRMYGGLVIKLDKTGLNIQKIETVQGATKPLRSEYHLN